MKNFIFSMFMVITFLSITSVSSSLEIRVPGDYETLREAIDNALNGDTILITGDDTIVEKNIYINPLDAWYSTVDDFRKLNIPKKDIHIKGESIYRNRIDGTTLKDNVFRINADGVVLENLIITRGSRGIRIDDSAPLIINCLVENNDIGITMKGANAFLPNPVLIANSEIINNRIAGLDTGDIAKFKILNSCFSGSQATGIMCSSSGANSYIKNCIFKENIYEGLMIKNNWNGVLANNVFDGNGVYGINVLTSAVNSFIGSGKAVNNNNIYINNETGVRLDAINVNFKWGFNCFYNNKTDFNIGEISETTILENPDFANTNCRNHNDGYALNETSPCINTGNPLSFWNDYDGTRNDMGARGGPAMNVSLNLYITSSYWSYRDDFNDNIIHEVYRSAEPFTDITGNGKYDSEFYWDDNNNGKWDDGEKFFDSSLPGFREGYYDAEPFADAFADKSKNGLDSPPKKWIWDEINGDNNEVPEEVWNKNVWDGNDTLCMGYYITIPNVDTSIDFYFGISAPGYPPVFLKINEEGEIYGTSFQVLKSYTLVLNRNSIHYDKVVIPITDAIPAGEYTFYFGIQETDTGNAPLVNQYKFEVEHPVVD